MFARRCLVPINGKTLVGSGVKDKNWPTFLRQDYGKSMAKHELAQAWLL
jgi:hypothetical protein